jgi:UDP-2,3-diacylglucosamine pyrophosphatase LpxH
MRSASLPGDVAAKLSRPLCILGDAHLGHGERPGVCHDLARLLEGHAGHEVVLNGDSFDLSLEAPGVGPAQSVVATLRSSAALSASLRQHLSRGDAITLVAGNHDAAIATERVRDAILSGLELATDAPLDIVPWLVRRGGVHVEHGHLFDPDNAPNHPLCHWTEATEPIGIALTRRFVGPAGAADFAHSDQTTPLAGLLRTFRLYGPRAPLVVGRYYRTAFELAAVAGRQPGLERERERGDALVPELGRRIGVDADALRAVIRSAPEPTHHRHRATFRRLYLDRSLATAALALSIATGATGTLAAASAAYLGVSLLAGTNRYAGRLERDLAEGARTVRELLGARWVVFGHTHRMQELDRYTNPGSFAYPAAERLYVVVALDERVELRALRA